MKKHIFKIISIFIIFIIMFNIVGCKTKNDNHQHDLKYYEKTEATCETDGNIEYWKCTTCSKYFSDAKGEKEISDVTIKKLPHQYSNIFVYSNEEHAKECINCYNTVDKEKHIFDDNDKCIVCDYQDVLNYRLLDDDTYEVMGLNNKNLINIIIPKYYNNKLVTSIGEWAFEDCPILESITIPSSVQSIGEGAFSKCPSLIDINIQNLSSWCQIEFADRHANPLQNEQAILKINGEEITTITEDMLEGVAGISNYAFCYKKLQNIEISPNVISIGDSAFENCIQLQSITIPSSVQSIGHFAFLSCPNLKEVNITSLESWCKINFGGYAANPLCEGAVLKINGVEAINITEDMLEGITSIGEYAFNYNKLQSIEIPASIEIIKERAFLECSNLKEVNITSLESWCKIKFGDFDHYYFANPLQNEQAILKINGVEAINITKNMLEGITSISRYAFCYKNLQSIEIPATITNIGYRTFNNCPNLSSIIVDSNNPVYDSRDNCNAIIETSTNTLIVGCKDTIIPTSITSIGSYAFYECINLETITIQEGITSIGEKAFYNCNHLDNIIIPSSVISIGFGAFENCINLKAMTIPFVGDGNDNTYIGYIFGANNYSWNDYLLPKTLKEITIIGGENIHSYAFAGCTNLTKVIIQKNVKNINERAFFDCNGLQSITISESVESIGALSFYNCKDLSEVNITNLASWCQIKFANKSDNPLYASKQDGKQVVLKINGEEITTITEEMLEGVTSIGYHAFFGCTSLQSITFPSSVTSIEEDAFLDCTNLSEVNLISLATLFKNNFLLNNKQFVLKINGEEISNLTTITEDMLQGITEIPSNAFRGLTSLTSITLPTTITNIGQDAFSGCTNLKEVNITSLALWWQIRFANEFANPLSNAQTILKINGEEITIITEDMLEGVTEIPSYAFAGYNKLQSITFSSSLTSIGQDAFKDLTSLTDVNIKTLASWLKISFKNESANPLSNEQAILKINGEKIINITDDMLEGVIEIPSYAFAGYNKLQSITFSSSLTSIGQDAFSDCPNLKEVNITSLALWCQIEFANEFANPLSNEQAILKINGEEITTITEDMLEGVTEIPSYAFAGYNKLQSITFSSSVTSIGEGAFYDCPNLKEVNITSLALWCQIEFESSSANPLSNAEVVLKINGEEITNITSEMLEGVIKISNYAFAGYNKLQSITIPSSMASIGAGAFSGCANLKEVNITSLTLWCQIEFESSSANPLSNKQAVLKISGEEITTITEDMLEGVTEIPSYAFAGYNKLQSITLQCNVTSIGKSAFASCPNLQSVTISSDVTNIGESAFSGCPNLQNLTISSDVTSIGESAFSGCPNLQSVTISSGATSIEKSAFNNCPNLQSVTISSGVTSIGESAFNGCTNLKEINITSLALWCQIEFANESANPLSNAEVVLKINGEEITNITAEMLEGVTKIPNYAFIGYNKLQNITIPSSVTSIGKGAFSNCTNLSEVIFEDPNNWEVNGNILSSNDLNNPELAASYLTGEYISYDWIKIKNERENFIKKHIFQIISIFIVLIIIFILIGCKIKKHLHNLKHYEKTEANCETDGNIE